MTDSVQPEAPLALLLRVQEWSAWMPIEPDPQMSRLNAVAGETAVELYPGEQLVDIDVVATNETRTVPVPAVNGEAAKNVRVKLVVFRATLARKVKGELPEEEPPPAAQGKVILPDSDDNRTQRRKRKR